MKFIKLNPKAFSPYITLAINRSIAAGVFPDNIRVAKILPILKSGKDWFKKESYRPISNLHCLEKMDMIDCLDCGVIQGIKLSGLLYTIYTNKVLIPQEVLKDEEICETIGAKH